MVQDSIHEQYGLDDFASRTGFAIYWLAYVYNAVRGLRIRGVGSLEFTSIPHFIVVATPGQYF